MERSAAPGRNARRSVRFYYERLPRFRLGGGAGGAGGARALGGRLAGGAREVAHEAAEIAADAPQLPAVDGREPFENAPAAEREADAHLAPVVGRGLAAHHAELREAVDHAYGAMVLDEHLRGEVADGEEAGTLVRAHHEQRLVLLLGESDAFGRPLAERQELPQLVAERGEHRVLGSGERLHRRRPPGRG